jgi:hypothetical protein
MVSTAVQAGGRHQAVQAVPARPRRFRPDTRTTPARLRLLLVVLVLLSLAWGALAAFTASVYASAASGVVSTGEPLSLDALQIFSGLSDANDAATTAFLTGGLEPAAVRQRYLNDIAEAETGLEDATARGGTVDGATATELRTLAEGIPRYAGEIETARADNRIGIPLGAAYLREASGLMRGTLLPAAQDLYRAENASLGATSARATGLPLIAVTAVIGVAIGYVLYRTSRWLTRRTKRVFNVGVLVAGLAIVISLLWLAVAYASGRGALLTAQAMGSTPVAALARVDIAAAQAHADESLTLIDDSGDDLYQTDYVKLQRSLGPGPGTLLTVAQEAAKGSRVAPDVAAMIAAAQGWYAAHSSLRSLDNKGNHAGAVRSALGTGPTDAATWFGQFSAHLTAGMTAGQAAFDANAEVGSSAFTGTEPLVIVAALVMAVACAWGLNRRLAEYR